MAWWQITLIGCAAGVAAAVGLVMLRSRFGLQLRAVVANSESAEVLGIKTANVNRWAFALGCGVAGVAGALLAPLRTVFPGMGLPYLVAAFLVVILAGLGNIRQTVIWSVVVGLGTAAVAVPANDILSQIVVWSAALAIIATRRKAVVVARV
jgi:branched-subunit amino acid ABC-type transport system permease component